jgi:hypothetical protein
MGAAIPGSPGPIGTGVVAVFLIVNLWLTLRLATAESLPRRTKVAAILAVELASAATVWYLLAEVVPAFGRL